MIDISPEELRSLVRPDRVHRRVYSDPAIFALERERLFGRAWLYVAHESQLRHEGDFVRSWLGGSEVLVTRGSNSALNVLHNRCAHRGARIATAERGHCGSFICPYHGWSYAADGRLEGVPHRQGYPAGFRLEDPANHLVRAPRVDSYRGFVFASLAADGPPLHDHLGEMTESIDNLIDRAPDGEIEISDNSFHLEYRGNWKLHHENATDVFHPGFVHESSVATAKRASGVGESLDEGQTREMLRANDFTPREWQNIELVGTKSGHSYMSGFYRSGILAPQQEDAVRLEYRRALEQRHGAERATQILAMDRFNNLVYPDISINAQYHQLRVVRPVAVDRSIVSSYCFRLKGAPEGIFHRAVRFLTNLGSPASMIFTDDVEVFARCQAGLADPADEWVDIQRGLGRDAVQGPGRWVACASELPIRVQFGAWLDYMTKPIAAGA
jgi:phenylpropionate dioxygenase-like ring-hydroxylating dioxygenase large terminal subunit